MSCSHWKCTKHVAVSKLHKNKIVILIAAIFFYVSMSRRLPSWTFKDNLGSKVKRSGKRTHQWKPCFLKLKCYQFLYKTSILYILSVSYTSKAILDTKNVSYGTTFNANKTTVKSNDTILIESLLPFQKFE